MRQTLLLALFVIAPFFLPAQDSRSLYEKVFQFPDKFFGEVQNKSDRLQQALIKTTLKQLGKLERREMKLKRKLAKTDSASAAVVFGDVKKRYSDLRNSMETPQEKLPGVYSSYLDSMKTSISFLQYGELLDKSNPAYARLQEVWGSYERMQGGLNQAEFIQQQLRERQNYLASALHGSVLGKSFLEFKKNVYYYRAQVERYRDILERPGKLESVLLSSVAKLPVFHQFFAGHSELGSVFQLPGVGVADPSMLQGMQTRELLMQELGQRLGGGPSVQNQVSGTLSSAQSSLSAIKEKLNSYQSNGDPEIRDFKVNPEKTKSFLQRLELGVNIQSARSNLFFPQTTDVLFSVGYKFKPNIIAGVGASYRMGWGRDFRHIEISHQGAGFRTYYEMKLKGSFWASGGAEWMYRSGFKRFDELKDHSAWQQSALIGVNKKYRIRKFKGEVKLLYDFLWRSQKPAGQPIVFRTGYLF